MKCTECSLDDSKPTYKIINGLTFIYYVKIHTMTS